MNEVLYAKEFNLYERSFIRRIRSTEKSENTKDNLRRLHDFYVDINSFCRVSGLCRRIILRSAVNPYDYEHRLGGFILVYTLKNLLLRRLHIRFGQYANNQSNQL